jgi:general stress protein 26
MGVTDVPKTTLDQRFSAPQAAATDWDETRHALETAELFWLTTVRLDGRPHVTPLVGVWLDGALHFCTGTAEQKAVNLRSNPHVILTTGRNDWDKGLDVVVEGDAVPVTDNAALTRLAAAWTTKWDGSWHYAVGDGGFHHQAEGVHAPDVVLVFSVTPTKVFAFAKDPSGQTRHQF